MVNSMNIGVLMDFVRRDLKSQYTGSIMGLVWLLINPAIQILIYLFVFGFIFKSRPSMDAEEIPYFLYLVSALVPWISFSHMVSRCTQTLMDHAHYLKKLTLPKAILFWYPIVSLQITFLIMFSLILLIDLTFYRILELKGVLLYLGIYSVFVLFTYFLGRILGTLNVFIRDIGQLLPMIILIFFWATPIAYPESLLPSWLKQFMLLNPFVTFMNAFRDTLLFSKFPSIPEWSVILLWTTLLAIISFGVKQKLEGLVVDEL